MMSARSLRRRPLSPVRLLACEKAVAAVEFALLAPVLALLLLGVFDLAWRLFADYRLSRAAAAAAELTARARELHRADLDEVLRAASEIAAPFGPAAGGAVILSGVLEQGGNRPIVLWQRAWPATAAPASRIGAPGGRADLGTFRLNAGENVVVAEIVQRFEPLVGLVVRRPQDLYYRWVAAPRYGPLTAILP